MRLSSPTHASRLPDPVSWCPVVLGANWEVAKVSGPNSYSMMTGYVKGKMIPMSIRNTSITHIQECNAEYEKYSLCQKWNAGQQANLPVHHGNQYAFLCVSSVGILRQCTMSQEGWIKAWALCPDRWYSQQSQLSSVVIWGNQLKGNQDVKAGFDYSITKSDRDTHSKTPWLLATKL